MEALKYKEFDHPEDLVKWVNKNDVTLVSTSDGYERIVLYYKDK